MISYKMARRSFIRDCGSAALLVPLLRSIEARAQGIAAPLRFLVIHHPLGASPGLDLWRPAGATAVGGAFTLPIETAPFEPLKSKMVLIDGLNIVTASKTPGGNNGGAATHEGGMVALMTGVPTLGPIGTQDHAAGGPSLDQLLLDRSPLLGGMLSTSTTKTSFQSLQLAADIRSDRDEIAPRVLSYRPPNPAGATLDAQRQPMYSETQPLNTWTRLFSSAVPSGVSGATLLAQKRSILDFMRRDLKRLSTLVPASEKTKLDMHAASIDQLQAHLTSYYSGLPATSTCTKPTMPMMFTQSGVGQTNTINGVVTPSKLNGVDYYVSGMPTVHPHQDLGLLQLRLIKTAFACDLARVATFMWSSGTNWVVFPGTFNGASILNNPQSSPHHPNSHSNDAATVGWLNQVNIFYSQQTSTILQEFDAPLSDSDGNSLLDNTLVAYVTEVARAYDHNQSGVPFAFFGGKNTKLKGGTYLKVTGGTLPSQSSTTGNRPLNDAWLAMAPTFGVTLPSLGNMGTQYTGPLAGIFA